MPQKVSVGGLAGKAWSVVRIRDAFVPFGPIDEITLGQQGRAVIVFKYSEDAVQAVENMDGAVIEGNIIIAQLAKTNVDTSNALAADSRRAVWGSSLGGEMLGDEEEAN